MKRTDAKSKASMTNRLVGVLPTLEYERLLANLEVSLTNDTVSYDLGYSLKSVYFPTEGIISQLGAMNGSSTLDIGVVRGEGVAGLPLFIGVKTSGVRSIVQTSGPAMRTNRSDFDDKCRNSGSLPVLFPRFSYLMMLQVWQSAMCARCHTLEKRIVRRLLMTSDRMGTNKFKLTQDVLSKMVGVPREALSVVARSLKKKGLITYSRGNINIINRRALEASACKCYSIIRGEELKTKLSV